MVLCRPLKRQEVIFHAYVRVYGLNVPCSGINRMALLTIKSLKLVDQIEDKMLLRLALTISLSLLLGVKDASSTVSVGSQVISKYRNLGKIILILLVYSFLMKSK